MKAISIENLIYDVVHNYEAVPEIIETVYWENALRIDTRGKFICEVKNIVKNEHTRFV